MQKSNGAAIKWSRNATMKIVYTAVFTAIAVVANAFFKINIGETLKFSFNLTVYFISGALLGPIAFLVGFLGDIIGFALSPDGAFNPLISLSEGLFCFFPGLIFYLKRLFKLTLKHPVWDTALDVLFVILSFAICYVICTVLLTSAGLFLYYSATREKYKIFWALVSYRAVAQLPNTAVNLGVSAVLYVALKRIGLLSRANLRKDRTDK